jgi:hypothetical protein
VTFSVYTKLLYHAEMGEIKTKTLNTCVLYYRIVEINDKNLINNLKTKKKIFLKRSAYQKADLSLGNKMRVEKILTMLGSVNLLLISYLT